MVSLPRIVALAIVLATSTAARADVPRDRAYALFEQANPLYLSGRYAEALSGYQQALDVYDHPRIRLAMVRTLAMGMSKPREAYPHLLAVFRDLERLDLDEREEARRLRNILLGQLGFVRLHCATDGVEVTVDGEALACAAEPLVVTVGRHQVVGRKPAYLTAALDAFVESGRETVVELRLVPLVDTTEKRRYWPLWKPWLVVAVGGAVAAAGVPLQLSAAGDFDELRRDAAACDAATGCAADDPRVPMLHELEDRGRLKNRIAVGLFVAGGVVTASGLTLVLLNRERTVVRDLAAAPLLAPGAAALSIAGRF